MLLNTEQVKAAIIHNYPIRPPIVQMLWHNSDTIKYFGEKFKNLLLRYPDDIVVSDIAVEYWNAPPDDPEYRWAFGNKKNDNAKAIDNKPIIEKWSHIDEFIAKMPNPDRPSAFEATYNKRKSQPDKYILECWGHYFQQRAASLRGIENLLFDYYDYPEMMFKLFDAFLAFYDKWAKRAIKAGANGVWAGDDLGTQNSLFMNPEIFKKFIKPYYSQLADILHSNNLDFWLHSCGQITEIMPDIIEAGVDVLHPIQCGVMNPDYIANNYSGKITFWVGMDVQNLIPFCSVEDIKKGIVEHAEKFYSAKGGVIYGAGNSLMEGIPFENIEAYVQTLTEYCNNKTQTFTR